MLHHFCEKRNLFPKASPNLLSRNLHGFSPLHVLSGTTKKGLSSCRFPSSPYGLLILLFTQLSKHSCPSLSLQVMGLKATATSVALSPHVCWWGGRRKNRPRFSQAQCSSSYLTSSFQLHLRVNAESWLMGSRKSLRKLEMISCLFKCLTFQEPRNIPVQKAP